MGSPPLMGSFPQQRHQPLEPKSLGMSTVVAESLGRGRFPLITHKLPWHVKSSAKSKQ